MKSFTLKLKVTDNATRKWQVFLESYGSQGEILHWSNESPGIFTKVINQFQIMDTSLEVFISCTGYGSSASCEIYIDNNIVGNVTAYFNDSTVANKSISIP